MEFLLSRLLILDLRCRGVKLNLTSMEEWMKKGKATALEHSFMFYNELKGLGVKIILVSSRRESLRSATVDNLVNAGFYGWKTLILRFGISLPFGCNPRLGLGPGVLSRSVS